MPDKTFYARLQRIPYLGSATLRTARRLHMSYRDKAVSPQCCGCQLWATSRQRGTYVFAFQFSPLTKRFLRPAFSDYAHFFLFLYVFFLQCTVQYTSNALPLSYISYTSSLIFWSFHMSYHVCLVPPESDSNGAYSAGAVAARRQNGIAVAQRASARGFLIA